MRELLQFVGGARRARGGEDRDAALRVAACMAQADAAIGSGDQHGFHSDGNGRRSAPTAQTIVRRWAPQGKLLRRSAGFC